MFKFMKTLNTCIYVMTSIKSKWTNMIYCQSLNNMQCLLKKWNIPAKLHKTRFSKEQCDIDQIICRWCWMNDIGDERMKIDQVTRENPPSHLSIRGSESTLTDKYFTQCVVQIWSGCQQRWENQMFKKHLFGHFNRKSRKGYNSNAAKWD